MVALEQEDMAAVQQLLQQYPELEEFADCLSAIDGIAVQANGAFLTEDAAHQVTVLEAAMARGERHIDPQRKFGPYELLDELGRGAMGIVYKARHSQLQRFVALKMISAGQLAGQELVDRFYQEARAAAKIRHPHIVGIHDIGSVDGQHYFAMDYVPAGTLGERLRNGRLSFEQSAQLMATVADAVGHLHEQGILHRDLKPANILLQGDLFPFIADFGLAKVFEAGSVQTRTGAIIGTPSYMSPEQAAGRTDQVSYRSDIYALGAVLYELLTGRPPFREATWTETTIQVVEGEPIRPTKLNPAVPPPLELICLKCLEKDPDRRYATAQALANDLRRYLQNEPVEASAGGYVHQIVRWGRRQPALACHWGALALAMLIIQGHGVVFPEAAGDYRLIEIVLFAWAASSGAWQWMANREATETLGRTGFLVSDVAFVTGLLFLASGPPGTLQVLYPLLIAASGLWFRPSLVWWTTTSAIIGALVGALAIPELRTPWHYPLIVMIILLVTGLAVAHQVGRVRALSRFYDRRPGMDALWP